jgi:hypothetical protein
LAVQYCSGLKIKIQAEYRICFDKRPASAAPFCCHKAQAATFTALSASGWLCGKPISFSTFADELPIGGGLVLELRFELWIAFFSRKSFELKGVLQIFGN